MSESILKELFALRDEKYRDFQSQLIPTVDKEAFIGVRTPKLKALAKKICKTREAEGFLKELPHRYFDENQLHAFIISGEKDLECCIAKVEEFLPYVDNWATCDQLSPKVFAKSPERLLPYIDRWLKSVRVYTVRFGVSELMRYFLGERFDKRYADKVAAIDGGEYYVDMMCAWYFATALAKNYEKVVVYLENGSLDKFVHNMTIKKACESFRISDEKKAYLKALKR